MTPWSERQPGALPATGAIELWRFELTRPLAWRTAAAAWVSAEEQQRMRAMVPVAAERFLVGRAALRQVLGRYLARAPEQLRFRVTPSGKPELASEAAGERLAFNLSHAGRYGLIACRRDGPIGVDLELLQPFPLDAAAGMTFSSPELLALKMLPEQQRLLGFYLGWTRKEAYLKARGHGLSVDPRTITVELDPARPAALLADERDPDAVKRWSIMHLDVATEHVGAVATQGEITHIQYGTIEGWLNKRSAQV